MSTSEIDRAYGIPRDETSLANELKQVLHDVGKCRISKEIKPGYSQRYFRRFIKRLNKEE